MFEVVKSKVSFLRGCPCPASSITTRNCVWALMDSASSTTIPACCRLKEILHKSYTRQPGFKKTSRVPLKSSLTYMGRLPFIFDKLNKLNKRLFPLSTSTSICWINHKCELENVHIVAKVLTAAHSLSISRLEVASFSLFAVLISSGTWI